MKKKEKGKLLDNLPACAVEFVKLVIKKMRYRKRVRAEVMAELIAHFEDELRSCETDDEKEQKAKQLIADFGDVKLLAVLLRRAKKRCRPLWQTVVARTFQTIGILILCLIVYLTWFLTGKPVITTDYVAELNRIVRPAADEKLNAAPLYNKAAELYGKASDDFLLFFAENHKKLMEGYAVFFRSGEVSLSYLRTWPQKVGSGLLVGPINELFSKEKSASFDEDRKLVQRYVATNMHEILSKKYSEATDGEKTFIKRWVRDRKEAIELLIAGTQKPYYWPKYETGEENTGEMMAVLLPHLAEFRKLVYALRWRAWLSVEDGRYEDAFSDIKSCYRFGKHIKSEDAFLIEQLVGMALERLATQTLHGILNEYQIDSATLVEVQQDFERMTADENFIVSLKFEKLCMYDVIQRCFTEDRFGEGHLSLDGLWLVGSMTDSDLFEFILEGKHWTAPLHILFTHPNKQQTREMAERYYAWLENMFRKTPAQIRAEGMDIENETTKMVEGNLLLQILTPAVGRVAEISYRTKADIEATLAIIAILRYKQDKGDYPKNLQELVTSGYLKELPIDPFSDKPLVYKKTDDDFILYSVGLNFKNDGGLRYSENPWGGYDKGDRVFWPVPK